MQMFSVAIDSFLTHQTTESKETYDCLAVDALRSAGDALQRKVPLRFYEPVNNVEKETSLLHAFKNVQFDIEERKTAFIADIRDFYMSTRRPEPRYVTANVELRRTIQGQDFLHIYYTAGQRTRTAHVATIRVGADSDIDRHEKVVNGVRISRLVVLKFDTVQLMQQFDEAVAKASRSLPQVQSVNPDTKARDYRQDNVPSSSVKLLAVHKNTLAVS